MYKVIMAPTEGSNSESAAISTAVKLAQRFDAELHLVRVQAAPVVFGNALHPAVMEIAHDALGEERTAGLRKLEVFGFECRALGGIRVTTALEEGPVAP